MLFLLLACTAPQESFELATYTLVDESRPVPQLGAYPGAPERTIELYVWSDASTRPAERPLLLLAHGVDGHPEKFDRYARLIAAGGYVVAAPRFPATSADSDVDGFAGLADFKNQPDDLTFVHGWLVEAVGDRSHALYHRFDAENLGLIGHSLGAATALVWGHYDCCRTGAVRASLLSAPPYEVVGNVFDGQPDPSHPTVLVHGEDDETVPPSESADLADDIDELARVLLPHTGHSDAIETQEPLASQDVLVAVTLGLFDELLRGEDGALAASLP